MESFREKRLLKFDFTLFLELPSWLYLCLLDFTIIVIITIIIIIYYYYY